VRATRVGTGERRGPRPAAGGTQLVALSGFATFRRG